MSDNTSNNGGMMMGFLVGTALGAGLALLLAPNTGQETRRRLGVAAQGVGDNARSMFGDARQEMKDGIEDVKGKLEDGKNRLAEGLGSMGRDLRDVVKTPHDGSKP